MIPSHETNQQEGALKQLTGKYRTREVIILGFLFCKHESIENRLDAFWELICPDDSQEYVPTSLVESLLRSLQNISIAIPQLRELSEQKKSENMIAYFGKLEQAQKEAIV